MWTVSDDELIEIYFQSKKNNLPVEFISLIRAEIVRRSLKLS